MVGSRTCLLVGLGNRDNGDDAVGPLVVSESVRRIGDRGIRLRAVEHEDPVALLDLCPGVDLAVVVDAVRSGRAPGSVIQVEAGAGAGPLPTAAWSTTGRASSHALGLAAVVELARALDRLPPRLVIVGVEADVLRPGTGVSSAVAAAVERTAGLVCDLLLTFAEPPG